jgi:hypothetical protein
MESSRKCLINCKFLKQESTFQPLPTAASFVGNALTSHREMENISRGPTFGDLVTIRTEGSMLDIKVARLQKEYILPSPSSFKCNVLRESLSMDSQNIPCATLKSSLPPHTTYDKDNSEIFTSFIWNRCLTKINFTNEINFSKGIDSL